MNIVDMMIDDMVTAGIPERTIVETFAPQGTAKQSQWLCEDGYIVSYTTSRVFGGPHHDRWAVSLYKPVGKGAKTGKANEWKRIYDRGFATRKSARKRAEALYYKHSPKAALRHGYTTAPRVPAKTNWS